MRENECKCDCQNHNTGCEVCPCKQAISDLKGKVSGLKDMFNSCCEEVHDSLDDLNKGLCEETRARKKADDELQRQIDEDFNEVEYNKEDKKLYFRHSGVDKAEIDVTDFIKDGMLDDAYFDEIKRDLVLVFNLDSGKEPIRIPANKIFDPDTMKIIIDNALGDFNALKNSVANQIGEVNKSITNISNTIGATKSVDPQLKWGESVTLATANNVAINAILPAEPEYYNQASIDGRTISLKTNKNNTTPIAIPDDIYVRQDLCTHDADFPVLLAHTANATADLGAQPAYFASGVKINPHTGVITGTAARAVNDGNGNPIANTYATKTDVTNLSNTYLTKTEANSTYLTQQVANNTYVTQADTPTDYINGGTINGDVITLTRKSNQNPVVLTVTHPTVTHPKAVSSVVVNGTQLTVSYTDGSTPDVYPIAGDTTTINTSVNNITNQIGDATNPSDDSILGRLAKLESYWEIDSTDSTRLIAKNNRSAAAAGFYDTTIGE